MPRLRFHERRVIRGYPIQVKHERLSKRQDQLPPDTDLPISRRVWDSHPVLSIFVLALVVRTFTVLISAAFFQDWVLDDATWSRIAESISRGERHLWDAQTHLLYRKTFSFLAPLSLIYEIFGPVKIAGQLYVAIIGAAVAAVATRVALEFLPIRTSLAAGAFVALLPSQVMWSSSLLKDPTVWLFLAASALGFILITKRYGRIRWMSILIVALSLLALGFVREHTLVAAAWALILASVLLVRGLGFARSAALIATGIAVPLAVGIGPAGFTLATNAGSLEQRRLANAEQARSAFVDTREREMAARRAARLEALQARLAAQEQELARLRARRQYLLSLVESEDGETASTRERAAAREELRDLRPERKRLREELRPTRRHVARLQEDIAPPVLDTVEEEGERLNPDLVHLPRGLFVMLLEPTPWGWSDSDSETLKLARLESLLWYPLLGLALFAMPASFRQRQLLAYPVLAGGAILLMYALTEGNIGTAYRHRGDFVWVVALLAALGLQRLVTLRQRT